MAESVVKVGVNFAFHVEQLPTQREEVLQIYLPDASAVLLDIGERSS